jgi:E3 ubiquitin-protein ligase listerin
VTSNPQKLFSSSPSLLFEYITHRGDNSRCLAVWRLLLKDVAEHPERAQNSLSALADAVQRGNLPGYLRPEADELDSVLGAILAEALQGSKSSAGSLVMTKVFKVHGEAALFSCILE